MTSFIKNLATSAEEKKLDNASTIIMDKNNQLSSTVANGKKCKILISCVDAKKLVDQIRESIKVNSGPFDHEVKKLIDYVNDAANKEAKDYQDILNAFKNYQVAIDKAKTEKDKRLKTSKPPSPEINVHVHVKGEDNDNNNGKIKSFNVAKKSVTVTYTNVKGKQETLEDIDINKLCITDSNCIIPISGGAILYKSNNDDQNDKNYKIICE